MELNELHRLQKREVLAELAGRAKGFIVNVWCKCNSLYGQKYAFMATKQKMPVALE